MIIKLRIKINICALLTLFLSLLNTSVVKTQKNDEVQELCSNSLIKTILFHRSGWDLSMPVIFMEKDEILDFRFDYLAEPEIDFSYAIANCNYHWQINDISEHYYLEGFNDISIFDYNPSRNTTQYYTHYKLSIPNDDLKITRSGNYILKVYDSSDPDSIIIARRFALVDRKVEITARVNRPDDENQEILLSVDLKNLKLMDPFEEIKIVIIKNYDWNNEIRINSKPVLRNNVLHYQMPYQIMAKGGNEFRYADTKDFRFISQGVEDIEFISPYYYFRLKPDKLRQYDPYFSSSDLNGRSFYEIPDAQDRHLDTDYVYVDFKLESMRHLGSDVYVYGALTNWQINESNYMVYKPEEGLYETTLLLKQGTLNYAFATRDYDSPEISFEITEGNHDETENDFLIFVYYRSITGDFDELVGYEVVNSMNKQDR